MGQTSCGPSIVTVFDGLRASAHPIALNSKLYVRYLILLHPQLFNYFYEMAPISTY